MKKSNFFLKVVRLLEAFSLIVMMVQLKYILFY